MRGRRGGSSSKGARVRRWRIGVYKEGKMLCVVKNTFIVLLALGELLQS